MRIALISSLGLVVGLIAAGCSGDDCSSSGSCISPDGGSPEASGSDVVNQPDVPQNCDLGADLATSPACIDDGVGVFVDGTNGDDANPGTKESPFKTIAKGIAAAGALPRVYVCAGTYAEDVSLTQTNAVAIMGGMECGSWTYDGAMPIVGVSTVPLRVAGVVKPIVLSDLTFQAAGGANPGDSSIAALVTSTTDLTLRRVKLRPGAGHDGAPGVTGSNWTAVNQDDASIAGKNASGNTGGAAHACTLCTDNVNSTGGAGGAGGTLSSSGGDTGAPNLSASPPDDGAGGDNSCTAGHNGANAPAGTAAPGATLVGKLTTAGWVPSPGQDGPNGGPGQGGGGGGGKASVTNPGGGAGGGCGGCGGAGGKGGGGGGASIGLAVISSKVTLQTCDIVTLAGGAGGAGSAGQDGQLGGYAGTASPGCAAGVGGKGGLGGSGGGGAGGISVGIVYTDQQPEVDQATSIVVPGTPATKGTGGTAGTNDGVDGLAQATFQASSS